MSVPNTTTFSLTDVVVELGGGETSLQACFDNAIDSSFDTTYKGNKNELLNFRNYNTHTLPIAVPTSGVSSTPTRDHNWVLLHTPFTLNTPARTSFSLYYKYYNIRDTNHTSTQPSYVNITAGMTTFTISAYIKDIGGIDVPDYAYSGEILWWNRDTHGNIQTYPSDFEVDLTARYAFNIPAL